MSSHNMNDIELIKDVLKMRRSEVLTYAKIAKVVNSSYGTAHTGQSVKGIWRRHKDKRYLLAQPQVPLSKYKRKVPWQLDDVRLLIIPDLHIPFVTDGFFDFLERTYYEEELTEVLCIGDVVDEYALSQFEKDPDALSAGNELLMTKDYLKVLAQIFPKMRITIGNHDRRYRRLARKAGLPEAVLKGFLEVFDTPDTWEWHYSFILNGKTLIEHGTRSGYNATRTRAEKTAMNVIQGHTHCYAGVQYINDGITKRWGLNVGSAVDENSYAVHYALDNDYHGTKGCGILKGNEPHFKPFNG